jgi:hypothetical protein
MVPVSLLEEVTANAPAVRMVPVAMACSCTKPDHWVGAAMLGQVGVPPLPALARNGCCVLVQDGRGFKLDEPR